MRVRSPMGANRALVAKCAPDGFRESLARFRADRPPTSLTSVGQSLTVRRDLRSTTRSLLLIACLSTNFGFMALSLGQLGSIPISRSALRALMRARPR